MKLNLTMIGWTAAAFLAACLLVRGQPGARPAAETRKEPRTIHTAGTATVKIKPDSARVFFGVQTLTPAVKAAREQNSQKVQKFLEAVLALKIPDLKMKTTNLNVEVVQSQQTDAARLPEIVGYRVTNTFSVLVKDRDAVRLGANASRVLDAALENGANLVQQIVFFKEDEAAIRRDALAKAVEEALANARAIASGARVQVLDTFRLEGQPEFAYGPGQCGLTNTVVIGGPAAGETPVIAGDLEVTCRVSVSCSY
jgi:uncharacterized protein YggE